jgi:hypothetical protein
MIGATLNCIGVGKKGMSGFLSNLLKHQQLNFIGLPETIKKDILPPFLGGLIPEVSLIGNGSAQLVEEMVSWVVLGYPGLPFVILVLANFISR